MNPAQALAHLVYEVSQPIDRVAHRWAISRRIGAPPTARIDCWGLPEGVTSGRSAEAIRPRTIRGAAKLPRRRGGTLLPGRTAFMGNGASVAAERDAEREKDPRRRHARESEFEENQRRREEARPALVRAVRDAPGDFAFTPDAGEGARGPRVRRGRTSTTGRGRVAAAGSTRRGSVVRRRPWPRIRCPGCRAGSRRAKRSSSVSRGPR